MEVPLLTARNDFGTVKKKLILLNIYTNARNRYVSALEKHLFLDEFDFYTELLVISVDLETLLLKGEFFKGRTSPHSNSLF